MNSAPLPLNETARLRALRDTNLLDSAPDQEIDSLIRALAFHYDVPIALVSLLDADRQWFMSRVGLDAQQTPRDLAFCGHAILQEGVMVVPDATRDPRFADNPLVTDDPHVCFYAGATLFLEEGLPLGTVCIIDNQPRHDVVDFEQLEKVTERVAGAIRARLSKGTSAPRAEPDEVPLHMTAQNNQIQVRVERDLRGLAARTWCNGLMSKIGVQSTESLVIDLSGCGHVDSLGVGAMVKILKSCKKHGIDLKLTNPQPQVRAVFDTLRLSPMFFG